MIKKIIYIGYQPLSEKVKNDFYLDNLTEFGFEVEYWDMTGIYFPCVIKDNFKSQYIIKFSLLGEVDQSLSRQKISATLFVLMITYNKRVLTLYRLLTKHNCYISFFARGMLPMPFLSTSLKSRFLKLRKVFDQRLLLSYLENKNSLWQKRLGFVKPYDLVFNAGEYGIYTIGAGFKIEKKKSQIIEINSFDFDKYITTKNSARIVNEKYCVFLDEYLPYHPDFLLFGIKTVDATDYYLTLNNFFRLIEKKFNVEVVIAAHPKAEKYADENPFEGRKILFNKTAELTKFAEFSLAHMSTSVSFSVLNEIPIIFLYNNCLKSVMPNHYNNIRFFSEMLSGCLINIDDFSIENLNINIIDSFKYKDYKYKFLTSKESEKNLSINIFCNFLLKLEN